MDESVGGPGTPARGARHRVKAPDRPWPRPVTWSASASSNPPACDTSPFPSADTAVASRAADGSRSLRIGGAVVPGSIHETSTGARFELVEGGKTVLEAFKPGTAPPDNYSVIGVADADGRALTVSPDADRSILRSGTGGLY